MAAHFLSDNDLAILKEIVDKYRKSTLNIQGRQPALSADHEEILTPEDYIALTPPSGIPANIPGTGTGGEDDPHSYDQPGFAECDIYRITEMGDARVLRATGESRIIYNLAEIAIAGLMWITPTRDKWGSWKVPSQGLQFTQCDGTGTGTGGSSGANCFVGNCGETGVPTTLTATFTSKVGCFTDLPDTLTFNCANNGSPPNEYHSYFPSLGLFNYCGVDSSSIEITGYGSASGTTPIIVMFGGGATSTITFADSGWTCNPFSAVFHVTTPTGASCTVTVIS